MRRVILFDIDHTLIDTTELRKRIDNALFKRSGAKKDDFANFVSTYTSTLCSSTDFNPNVYLKTLSQEFNVSIDKLSSIFYRKSFFKKSLYPETEWALQKLHKNFTLGIFSEGLKSFQRRKLALSGLVKLFDEKYIFIFRRKISNKSLSKIPKNAIFFDDNLNVTKKLFQNGFKNVYWLNRNNKTMDKEIETVFSSEHLLKKLLKH